MLGLSKLLPLDLFAITVYSHLSGPTWDLWVICYNIFYLAEVETYNLLGVFLNRSHIPSLSIAPTMTHLAYIRIYVTPKNKKRIISTAANKSFSYSDMQLFPSFWGLFDAAHLGVSHCKSLNAKRWPLGWQMFDQRAAWSIPRKFQCFPPENQLSVHYTYFPVFVRNLFVSQAEKKQFFRLMNLSALCGSKNLTLSTSL